MQLISLASLTSSENQKLQKLLSYEVSYNKLWNSDTGRSLTGAFSGKLVGIFPKLKITIRAQGKDDRAIILKAFNRDFDNVTYYDPWHKSNKTKQFYFGDISTEITKAVTEGKLKYGSMDVELVATTKLSPPS